MPLVCATQRFERFIHLTLAPIRQEGFNVTNYSMDYLAVTISKYTISGMWCSAARVILSPYNYNVFDLVLPSSSDSSGCWESSHLVNKPQSFKPRSGRMQKDRSRRERIRPALE